MKLLIVDDQSTVVQGLLHCTNWAAMGFTVVDTALNAVDAKASLLRQEAEVMLCDIEMPMESGLDLLDWLRQRGMTTRCIFLTAHAEFKYAQEALRLGGFDYIMQPAPYEQVTDAVSRALDNVKEEWAALELQSRGAVFDDQKKEIVETMLRGFLSGNAPGSSLTAFEELSLVPRRERECWVALMQPLRWKQGEEPVGAEPAEHGSGEYEQRGVHAAAGAQCNGGDPCRAVSRSGAAKPGGGAAGGRLYHPAAELSAKCVCAVYQL